MRLARLLVLAMSIALVVAGFYMYSQHRRITSIQAAVRGLVALCLSRPTFVDTPPGTFYCAPNAPEKSI